jgi:hypothetical protein
LILIEKQKGLVIDRSELEVIYAEIQCSSIVVTTLNLVNINLPWWPSGIENRSSLEHWSTQNGNEYWSFTNTFKGYAIFNIGCVTQSGQVSEEK